MASIEDSDVRRGVPVWLSYGKEASKLPEHQHWDTYDMTLEGARFNVLGKLLESTDFDAALAWCVVTDLEALAHSKGWGEQDSHEYFLGLPEPEAGTEEAAYRATQVEMHADDPDAEYTNAVDRSQRLLVAAAATPDALDLANKVSERMAAARTAGAAARIAASANLPPATAPAGAAPPGP